MKERTARTLVRVTGILFWILGLLMLETAFGFLAVDFGEIASFFDINIVRVVMVVVGLFFIVLGFQVQQFKHWARVASIIVGFIAMIGGVYFMVVCENTCRSWLLSLPFNLFRVLFGIFLVWFFTHEKIVVKLFTGQPAPAVKKK
jgi:hypothetical protein